MCHTGGAEFHADAVIVNGTSGNESIRVAGEAFGLGQDDRDGGPGHNPLIR
jgi:hypothetical protein